MDNLKSLYTNLLKSRVDAQAVLGEIDRLVSTDAPDGKKKALALEPKLQAVLAKEQQALTAYVNAIRGSEPANSRIAGTMKRSAFTALSAAGRMRFIKRGGKVSD